MRKPKHTDIRDATHNKLGINKHNYLTTWGNVSYYKYQNTSKRQTTKVEEAIGVWPTPLRGSKRYKTLEPKAGNGPPKAPVPVTSISITIQGKATNRKRKTHKALKAK